MRSNLHVDGVMTPATRSAIRAFQGRHRLVADGMVGASTEAALRAAGAGPPPGARSLPGVSVTPKPVPLAGAPRVLARESDPPMTTLYLDIALGGEASARPMTGVFIPSNFRRDRRIDAVVYLHGFKRDIPGVSINTYWNRRRFPQRGLREGVNMSTKNVILIAPSLGPRSQAGWLVQPGGFDRYLDHVLAAIRANLYAGWSASAPEIGNLILSGHSGGGLPLRQIALSGQKYASNIRECWGFDSMYNSPDPSEWTRWARAHPSAKLYIYYTDGGGTKANSLKLKSQYLPNVVVDRSPVAHDLVPITHWQPRLVGTTFLTDR
jgi:peptidoglycan hydrolase-like protein with peptidoglycan-binding domain